jgi:putative hemolysin
MNRTDSHAVAQATHDLGSALWFGGAVMGAVGVNRSGEELSEGIDRIRVAKAAWRRFAPLEWAGIGAASLAGLQLTRAGTRRIALQKGFGTVTAAKAATMALGTAATAYAAYCGNRIGKLAERANEEGAKVEVKDATMPTSDTPEQIATWQRRQQVAQYAVPALAGANIAFGAYLSQSFRPGATAQGVWRRLRRD